MPIESVCTGCGRTLRVADEHAGAEAQCPICSTVYRVPMPGPQFAAGPQFATETAIPSANGLEDASAENTSAANTSTALPTLYFAKIPSGAEFGPAPPAVLIQWAGEGRLNASCFVRTQHGPTWIPYLEWVQSQSTPNAPSVFSEASANTFGTIPISSEQQVVYPKSSRGTLVLVLGIVSWFLCFTWIGTLPVATIAVFIGRSDLQSIARGETSPKERKLTLIGMWLAAVALTLNLIFLLLAVASIAFRV